MQDQMDLISRMQADAGGFNHSCERALAQHNLPQDLLRTDFSAEVRSGPGFGSLSLVSLSTQEGGNIENLIAGRVSEGRLSTCCCT